MEGHRAIQTLITFVSNMNINMLFKVGLLGESLLAAIIFTYKWSLSSVCSEMVKEHVPSEELANMYNSQKGKRSERIAG